ncbi:hypothetical protein CKO28_23725 [Rhodovibrio sodomensis]|uniref:Uncharacterized protein n=1 Tax=Rhodovibrio sodomensis TaxID=1088 RepID=A0ABS1DLX6_9PROT|nr:hypothetical protein [Rhodovibrio sodomensis]MBK1671021.1 hypothetical protein [Rhodovibrio sodomensis]
MFRTVKTTAAVATATALMLGAGAAAPANADSAWPDVGERAGNAWTPGDGEPRPMDRSYFADREERAVDPESAEAKRDGDAGEEGFFATILDAIQRADESG